MGFDDSTRVDVLSGEDLSHLYSPDTSGVNNGNLGRVAWSVNGDYLYASRWGRAGRGDDLDLPGADSTIMQLLPLADGSLIFGAADPALGRLDRAGKRIWLKDPAKADFRGVGFLISQDGSQVRFGYEFGGKRPARFSLTERRLVLDPPADPALQPPRLQALGLVVEGWEDTDNPILDGRPLRLQDYETARSLAIAADGQYFLLGTEWRLRYYDRSAGSGPWGTPPSR